MIHPPLRSKGTHNLRTPSPAVVCLPLRLRVVSPNLETPPSALDALLSSGAVGDRQHAAGLAYRGLRRRYEAASRSTGRDGATALGDAAWAALSRRHAALIRAAGHERFALDRLCLDDEAPTRCEVERVREALGRVAAWARVPHA